MAPCLGTVARHVDIYIYIDIYRYKSRCIHTQLFDWQTVSSVSYFLCVIVLKFFLLRSYTVRRHHSGKSFRRTRPAGNKRVEMRAQLLGAHFTCSFRAFASTKVQILTRCSAALHLCACHRVFTCVKAVAAWPPPLP